MKTKINKIVLKIGTSTVVDVLQNNLNLVTLEKIVEVVSKIRACGIDVVLVSSGAVGVGTLKLNLINMHKTLAQKQACAAIGQSVLLKIYSEFFLKFNLNIAQVLLTHHVFDKSENESNAKNMFEFLFKNKVIPIVNTNDAVSINKNNFNNNDFVAAVVANLINANFLIILTDLDGVFDADPKKNKSAKLIQKINKINSSVEAMCKETSNVFGTGGMQTKLQAAKFLSLKKIPTAIVNGNYPKRIENVLNGNFIGTLIDID